MLLQINVSELYQDVLQSEKNRVLSKVPEKYDNAIVRDTLLIFLRPVQLQKMTEHHKVTCGCEKSISSNSLHASLLLWRKHYE